MTPVSPPELVVSASLTAACVLLALAVAVTVIARPRRLAAAARLLHPAAGVRGDSAA